jgi:pteridine reductase
MPNDPIESQSGDAPTAASDKRLAGKTVLITGAARRVGAAIARTLHAAGANIVLHYRSSSEDAAELAREFNHERSGSAATVSGDLLDIDKIPALANAATQAFGGLVVLSHAGR